MAFVRSCKFPELSKEFNDLFLDNETQFVIVGVFGSMACFDLFDCHAAFIDNEAKSSEASIRFHHKANTNIIYVQFRPSIDNIISADDDINEDCFLTYNSHQRISLARSLLLATQLCHIVVMVETSSFFDTSILSIYKGLKILRESFVLKFLPKLLKNSSAGSYLGKEVRLCSPRFLFYFEKAGRHIEDLNAYEIDMEDTIYQMLRTNFIITNNAQQSLFSIPKNKKFLYVNTEEVSDPITDSLDLLFTYIDSSALDEKIQYKPYRGYGLPYADDVKTADFDSKQKRNFMPLLLDHVDDAFQGFDDSISKYRGRCHFVRPSIKVWFETFKFMHKIFIENPSNSSFEAKDNEYKAFLENFGRLLDIDVQFFSEACKHGYELGLSNYSELLPHHYSKLYHESKLEIATQVFHKYARGPDSKRLLETLKENCLAIWMNGKQQCEVLSLRGNPCVMISNHSTLEESMHSSGVLFVSTCNCGKTQGRRDDPYTIRKANFEFYELMRTNCESCEKSESVKFPVFVPSIKDFKAAEVTNKNLLGLILSECSNKNSDDKGSVQLTQACESDLSLGSSSSDKSSDKTDKKNDDSEDDEIVVKIGELDLKEEAQTSISTTEYLASMPLLSSPLGLLPQFPSWSLQCIASSSFYSHNTGLTESQMPGFLSGTNFLLCWEVKIRLEHAKNWAENYEARSRNRKKKQASNQSGTFFTLKIFVGMEYECGRGHRFMMSSNNTIMRGISGGSKNNGCGSKVVFSDMPLYFPCPCKNSADARVAQLMRIHVVTPKAPVAINLDPKIKIRRETEMTFTAGWSEPYSLSQSAYWVLRLPYVFQGGDADPIPQPEDVPASTDALRHGSLLQGMFGIKEKESSDEM